MRGLLVLGLLAWLAVPAYAAEVSGLGAGGREVYVRLKPGEKLAVGDTVLVGGKKGVALKVVEVLGLRARLEAPVPVTLRPKDMLTVAKAPATEPAVTPQPWQVARTVPAGQSEQFAKDAQAWQAVGQGRRPWVDDVRILGRVPETRIDGHLTLVAAGLLDRAAGQSWGLMRLSNRLEVEGLFGTPLGWHHDVAAWLDHLGGVPGDSERRMLQIRQAEFAIATSPTRPFGGSLGRGYAPEGTGAGAIDGSTLRLRLGDSLDMLVFGGFLPSIASTAFDTQAWRFGAAAQAHGDLAGWRTWSQASWSLARQGQAWDRQLMGVVARGEHAKLGEVQGEVEVAAGAADLSGTSMAGRGSQDAALRPVRGLFLYGAPPLRGWIPRVRYSFYRAEMTRELAWTLPLPDWSASQYHQVHASLDTPRVLGFDFQAAGWGSLTQSADPWERWRWGASLRVGLPQWPSPSWNWSLLFAGQSGTTLTGASAGLGGEWSSARAWRVHARARFARDRVESTSLVSDAVDARVGFDWGRTPWILGLSIGGRRTLATDAPVTPDWVDATLVLSRRL